MEVLISKKKLKVLVWMMGAWSEADFSDKQSVYALLLDDDIVLVGCAKEL